MTKRTCSVAGCPSPVTSRGWCSKHYQRWRAHGDPAFRKTRELGLGRRVASCEFCGDEFVSVSRGSSMTRYCSKSCRGKADYRRSVGNIAGAQGKAAGRADAYMRRCAQCGEPYRSRNNKRSYCSPGCRQAAARRRSETRKAAAKALVHVGPRPECWSHAPDVPVTVIESPWAGIVSGPCDWCGEQFTSPTLRPRVFCSKRCAKNRSNARRGQFSIKPKRRLEIYERDGWVCQLCMEPVDRDAHYLDDWAPSLDHIVPQARTIVPDHSPENLRTAHRWCNAVRGDGTCNQEFFEAC